MPVLLVADSRGRGLQHRFEKRAPGIIRVSTNPGCNMKRLFKRACRRLGEKNYNTLIIMGGICSITYLDRAEGVARLGSHDPELYAEKVRKSIIFGISLIGEHFPKTQVIIAPTMGVDLERYNNMDWDQEDQVALNNIIIHVNRTIIELNQSKISIPWISAMVHQCKGKGRWVHRYKHLTDGCHYSRKLTKFCVDKIIRALTKL